MKKTPLIILIIIICLAIIFAIVFLISCKTGKCIFGGASIINGSVDPNCTPPKRDLFISSFDKYFGYNKQGICDVKCGADPRCDGIRASSGYSWSEGNFCYSCNTQRCTVKQSEGWTTGSDGYPTNYRIYYPKGNTCNYECHPECVYASRWIIKCNTDNRKGCSPSVCTNNGWDNSVCQEICNTSTHTFGKLCKQSCGASAACDAAYPGQWWVSSNGNCNWCTTAGCIYRTSPATKKPSPTSTCTSSGWSRR